jgi:hypothetical protein
VIIAPLAIIGALLFMRRGERSRQRASIDLPGAMFVASGMFLLVFGLSEGGTYGWWTPLKTFDIGGRVLWPATRPISMIPIVLLASVAILAAFTLFERAKERRNGAPLFEFAHLHHRTYRYGLLTGLILSMGMLGLSFVLPVFLQGSLHLSAQQNGMWQFPTGIFVIVSAQAGARLIHRYGATAIVRVGLVSYALGLAYIVHAVSLDLTWWRLLPGLALYGCGIGFAAAQLTNVVLSEIPKASSGVASGANTTVRQVGAALGVAVIGSLLTTLTASRTIHSIQHAALPANATAQAVAGVRAYGPDYTPSASLGAHAQATIQHALESGIASGTRYALLFALVVVGLGAVVSFLLPRTPLGADEHPLGATEAFEPLEPLDVDPALVRLEPAPEASA